jgi:hypothetical protein
MSRLFTFGCSFTFWPWPTWADIIAHELNIPYYNWGLPGIGNVSIHTRMLECELRHGFNEDDIILAVWSTWGREDRYNVKTTRLDRPGWSSTGDVLHTYSKNFIDSYWSVSNDLMKNSTAIISANRMFDVKFNGHISTPLINLHNDDTLKFDDTEKEVALFYEDYIPNDGEYDPKKHSCNYQSINDSHPDILSHLNYVIEYICPKLNMTLSNKTVDFFTGMHYHLSDFTTNFENATQNIMTNSPSKHWATLAPKVLEAYGWQNANQKLRGF